VSTKIEVREGESLHDAMKRLQTAVRSVRYVPPHKKLIKALFTRGQKRRQKKLSAAIKKMAIQWRTNPNQWESV